MISRKERRLWQELSVYYHESCIRHGSMYMVGVEAEIEYIHSLEHFGQRMI